MIFYESENLIGSVVIDYSLNYSQQLSVLSVLGKLTLLILLQIQHKGVSVS